MIGSTIGLDLSVAAEAIFTCRSQSSAVNGMLMELFLALSCPLCALSKVGAAEERRGTARVSWDDEPVHADRLQPPSSPA